MPFPIPELKAKPIYEPPAIVRSVVREDVLWNRPVFQAPPLVLQAWAERPSPPANEFDRPQPRPF